MNDDMAEMSERPEPIPEFPELPEPIPDTHELAHAHDHPELVADTVLPTDPSEVVASKKVLENEGGALESAYVVYETETAEAEYADASLNVEDAVPLDDTEPLEQPPAAPAKQSLDEWRLEELSLAIERYPNTVTNYVLRGEVYLSLSQDALAAADFQRALELAEVRHDELPWGYANAAFIDRAQNGLRRLNMLNLPEN